LFSSVDVTVLLDQQATRAGILDAFDRLAARVKPNDTFLFYIASHGVRDNDDKRFLLIPQDAADLSSLQALGRSAIDETTLIAALSRIRARDALLFLDTCYSGAVTADALANVGHETGRYLLAASSSVQEALDSYDNRNGVFVYAVREGLEGRASHGADDIVSALALGEYVSGRAGAPEEPRPGRCVQDRAGGIALVSDRHGDRRRAVTAVAPILLSRALRGGGWEGVSPVLPRAGNHSRDPLPTLPRFAGEGVHTRSLAPSVIFAYWPPHCPLAGCNADEWETNIENHNFNLLHLGTHADELGRPGGQ
jgi:hypothetical protein